MPTDPLGKIIQFRVPFDDFEFIKLICKTKTREWGRDYTVSDFVRDGVSLMKSYHNSKDALLANRDIIPLLLERLSKGRG